MYYVNLVEQLTNDINEAVSRQNGRLLIKLLKSKLFAFKSVIEKNGEWYLAQLAHEKQFRQVKRASDRNLFHFHFDSSIFLFTLKTLDKETIQSAILNANANADKQEKCNKT